MIARIKVLAKLFNFDKIESDFDFRKIFALMGIRIK